MGLFNIAVVNNSGNVGKSTICEVLLKPRLDNSEIVKIETINSDGSDDKKFSASEFNEIWKTIDSTDHVSIIDVGSSNIEQFLIQMQEYKGSQEDIDLFIIPVIPRDKQQIDAVSTIMMLVNMEVNINRISFIFNQADKKLLIEKQYSRFLEGIKIFDVNLTRYPVIYETQAFSMLSSLNKKFIDVVNDDRDFRVLLRETEDRKDRERLSEERSLKRLISGVNDDLDVAFSMLDIKA